MLNDTLSTAKPRVDSEYYAIENNLLNERIQFAAFVKDHIALKEQYGEALAKIEYMTAQIKARDATIAEQKDLIQRCEKWLPLVLPVVTKT